MKRIEEKISDTFKFEKLNKTNLRPIISSTNTYSYNLNGFRCDFLSCLVLNDYSCKDTFSFVS